MNALLFLLILGLFLLAYPLLMYPLLLWSLAFFRSPADRGRVTADSKTLSSMPSVSILLSVFNEEAALPAKLENFLALDYPQDLLELLVISDGSTDGGDDMVRRLDSPRVRLLRQEGRLGKTRALNMGAAEAKGDILVFTDADALFRPDCLRRLVAPFRDPDVSLAGGRSLYLRKDGGASAGGLYRRFEEWLKEKEGRLFGIAGADGAIYALRRASYEPLPPEFINDLTHPIQVALAGKKSVAVPEAVVLEPEHDAAPEQILARQTRIMAQSWLLCLRFAKPLLRRGRWGYLWQLASHKILRWLFLPIFVPAMALALILALAGHGPLEVCVLAGGLAFLVLAGRGARRRGGMPGKVAWMFLLQGLAAMRGLLRLHRGQTFVVWQPRGE